MKAADYIDADLGAIDRRVFWEPAIYERELERIFARSWLFVAHESQVVEPGSFITTYMGEDAVIVARADSGAINVFLNSCPHRGNRVCFADSGQGRSFVCNYHGWAFGLDGALRKMPKMGLYKDTPGFRMADWGLKPARVETLSRPRLCHLRRDGPRWATGWATFAGISMRCWMSKKAAPNSCPAVRPGR